LEELNSPIGLANAADGSNRLFILEQRGLIRILYPDGQLLPEPFLDISDKVDCCGERGLLGLAFHPNYRENGYFYINYTTKDGEQLTTIIARFQASSDADRADPGSEKELLRQAQPYPNHNGGGLAFGPDGYLYIGLGDGGSGGDPHGNGQSLDTWLGKLLRIDVDNGDPYAIPEDNPFAGGGGAPEIWAHGLRNPWRFSFDRLTGDLYIGDVGQGNWEEIDYLPAGSPGAANFGWNYFEGAHEFEGVPPSGVEMIPPVAEYSHGVDLSVTGGYVYRGAALPSWNGVYLYGDYGSGRVRGLVHLPDGSWVDDVLFELDALITSFGEDEAGEIYLTDHNGRLLRLEASGESFLPFLADTVRFGVMGD
jgi:glucose/arabinose dehydrogenase